MLVSKQLMLDVDIRSIFSIQWKSMATFNCLFANILQNILFCVQQKKETRRGLEQPKGE